MHLTLGISSISESTCDRKLFVYIISRLKKKFLQEDITPNIYMRVGKIIHTMLQITLKRLFPYIEYYYYRLNKSLEESIILTLKSTLEYWKFLLKKQIQLAILDISDYVEVIDNVNIQIPILCEQARTLIKIHGNILKNTVIDDEFNVSFEIIPGVLLTGKIDLVCFNEKEKSFTFIELKTGKPNPTQHNRQLRLYKEIFDTKQTKDINLELWNTKPGSTKKGFQKIKKLRKYKDLELKKLKLKIKNAIECKSEFDLPPPIYFPGSEKICMYCEYCDHIKVIFE